MENLGKRTTLKIAAIFLVATLGLYFSIKTMAPTPDKPHVCTCQDGKVTCTKT
jgi:hypothetical protein